jgi:hypothetical protein
MLLPPWRHPAGASKSSDDSSALARRVDDVAAREGDHEEAAEDTVSGAGGCDMRAVWHESFGVSRDGVTNLPNARDKALQRRRRHRRFLGFFARAGPHALSAAIVPSQRPRNVAGPSGDPGFCPSPRPFVQMRFGLFEACGGLQCDVLTPKFA